MASFKYTDKNVYYEEMGSGVPLILLHGNSVSSKLFSGVVDLYKEHFKVILIDFLGHGRSDRLDRFPADFWYDQAMQVIRLMELKDYGKVNLIGTSGGALVALNVALEEGTGINKVIADSFEGERALEALAKVISAEREQTKAQEQGRLFWEYCHGEDWEQVVDNDTDVILRHGASIKKFFHKDLSLLKMPVLLTASLKDEYAEMFHIEKTYKGLQEKIPGGNMHLFPTGGHPAMLTNAVAFFDRAKEFFG